MTLPFSSYYHEVCGGPSSATRLPSDVSTIAIVGAGFCGTLTAAHVLRADPTANVVLIERSGRFGPGLAYSTPSAVHYLNVPAGNMSAFEDDSGHFLRWAQERDPHAATGSFLPRGVYGQYLKSLLAAERSRAGTHDSGGRLREVHGDAIAVEPGEAGGAVVVMKSGERIKADRVVLAVGNSMPATPPGGDADLLAHSGYIGNPWDSGALDRIPPDQPVLIVGTGLTMMDVVMSLAAGDHEGRVLAISRHGLLPRPHRSPSRPPAHRDPPAALRTWDGSARGLVRALRSAVQQSAVRGTDWRDVVSSIRGTTPDLWKKLDGPERARFLNRLRSYWDIVRHRAAPETAAAVADLIASRRLSVRAGRLLSIKPAGRVIEATFRPRSSSIPQVFRAGCVINCLGPDTDVGRCTDSFISQLVLAGQIVRDSHGLGIETSDDGHAIGRNGEANPSLLVVGPMRRAQAWENTAVPELRRQAARVAKAAIGPPVLVK
jgi:uncharacterized NAD(P)/FAD-binding protein YdhS